MMRKTLRFFLILTVTLTSLSMSARTPKVGLVLGGGGAKGAATIGALDVIEKAGIKIDCIAGTSIGAVIGGLYAAGYKAKELEALFLDQTWQDILQGHRVEAKLKSLLDDRGVESFADARFVTGIEFRCIAADENTFEEVVLKSGAPLYKAMLASMSIPEIYEPVRWNYQYLVDGGVINLFPVDQVRDMGADIIIAIDLQQAKEVALGISTKELLGIGGLINWYTLRPDLDRYKQNLRTLNNYDISVYIHPSLPGYNAASFGREKCQRMLHLGKGAAKQFKHELREIHDLQQQY